MRGIDFDFTENLEFEINIEVANYLPGSSADPMEIGNFKIFVNGTEIEELTKPQIIEIINLIDVKGQEFIDDIQNDEQCDKVTL